MRSDIERKAAAVLKAAGVQSKIPVPLEEVANSLGFRTHVFNPNLNGQLRDVWGMIDYRSKAIYISESQHPGRKRFTLAHEIGHAALHCDDGEKVDFRADIEEPRTEAEREANQFAAALLMPREDFVRAWFRLHGDQEKIAALFGASKQAVSIRQKNLIDRFM